MGGLTRPWIWGYSFGKEIIHKYTAVMGHGYLPNFAFLARWQLTSFPSSQHIHPPVGNQSANTGISLCWSGPIMLPTAIVVSTASSTGCLSYRTSLAAAARTFWWITTRAVRPVKVFRIACPPPAHNSRWAVMFTILRAHASLDVYNQSTTREKRQRKSEPPRHGNYGKWPAAMKKDD